jgi:Transposase DDE domain
VHWHQVVRIANVFTLSSTGHDHVMLENLIMIGAGICSRASPITACATRQLSPAETQKLDGSICVSKGGSVPVSAKAVKMHTLLDLRGNIPSFIHLSEGRLHDVNILDQLIPEPGAFYIMDRGYTDYARLHRLHQAGSFFITRARKNMYAQRRYSHPVDRSTGVIFDQTLFLRDALSARRYPDTLRAVRYKDLHSGQRLLFITNNTASALKKTDPLMLMGVDPRSAQVCVGARVD